MLRRERQGVLGDHIAPPGREKLGDAVIDERIGVVGPARQYDDKPVVPFRLLQDGGRRSCSRRFFSRATSSACCTARKA